MGVEIGYYDHCNLAIYLHLSKNYYTTIIATTIVDWQLFLLWLLSSVISLLRILLILRLYKVQNLETVGYFTTVKQFEIFMHFKTVKQLEIVEHFKNIK